MLRRKLMVFLGMVALLLVATMGASLWQLQNVLTGLDHINHEAMMAVDQINTFNAGIAQVQVELYELQLQRKRRLDRLIEQVEAMRQMIVDLGRDHTIARQDEASLYEQLMIAWPQFERHVGALATARDPHLAEAHNQAALSASIHIQSSGLTLGQFIRRHAHADQAALTARFRWTVISLTLVFLIVINISIFVLLQMARIVVGPVETLTTASRALASGRFDTRVHVDQHDEFDELAASFNHMAEKLESIEQHRLDVLKQVALTLSHELNNASEIIELQLSILDRRSKDQPAQTRSLQQIRESLRRMTRTVQDLNHVRRIVLTDYTVSGLKMLDLQRSIELEAEPNLPRHVVN